MENHPDYAKDYFKRYPDFEKVYKNRYPDSAVINNIVASNQFAGELSLVSRDIEEANF